MGQPTTNEGEAMTMMEAARDEQRREYETLLRKVEVQGEEKNLMETQAGNYLSTGFAQGFINGYQTAAAATHAGLTVLIGELDAGLIDADGAKAKLIPLRDLIRQEAGL
ncbi:hypothetical protein SEA_PIONEER3_97 [Microbacterium phage Pioneer3]|nr:hypothetical protein SEA_PIONEER3_97 [Microbacterium phage Pioneer3]